MIDFIYFYCMEFALWSDVEKINYNNQEIEVPFNAKEVIKSFLPTIAGRENGYTFEELETRGRLLERLDQSTDSVDLDLKMVDLILKRMSRSKFAVACQNLFLLNDKLNKLYVQLSQHK